MAFTLADFYCTQRFTISGMMESKFILYADMKLKGIY